MKTLNLMIATFTLLSINAQAVPTTAERVLVKELHQRANLMPVIHPGYRPIHTTFTIEVLSNGCTDQESFKIESRVTQSGQFVEFVRIHPDFCRAIPHRKTLELETKALQLSSQNPILLQNPVFAVEQVVY